MFALNDPFRGGTHLPDVTLVSPLDDGGGERIVGYAVTRAHHSDVGGMSPGSMPSDSRTIYQEGIVIPPLRLVRAGEQVPDVLDLILANVRTPDVRRGDLRAQLAANALAGRRLAELIERRGRETVLAAFAEVVAYAERRSREAIAALPDGRYEAAGEIEGDGASDGDVPIRVAVDDRRRRARRSTSTAPPRRCRATSTARSPSRARPASSRCACVLPHDIPQNAGVYAPLTIVAPEGSLVNARSPAAVVAGNVETSQRIADTVLLALGQAIDVPAQGQGTMNNLVIGGAGWTYYETIGGGQGASASADGPSGVHVGMSNTLNTPIEAFELEYPLRVERYELAEGSGGAGEHRGGDGIVRAVRALEPASLSLLTDRRRHAPRGAHGGEDGQPGENVLNGEPLPSKVGRELAAGDVVSACARRAAGGTASRRG